MSTLVAELIQAAEDVLSVLHKHSGSKAAQAARLRAAIKQVKENDTHN